MSTKIMATPKNTIRIATFNVSMEATNYVEKGAKLSGNELNDALRSSHQQIKNIAEIIQTLAPDIILLNEFDYQGPNDNALPLFLNNYLAKPQGKQQGTSYPYHFQAPVNTGVLANVDLNGDGKLTLPVDAHGFGHFPGQYGMVLLSKYPIDQQAVRTFQYFKWKDMPGASQPINPDTKLPYYSDNAWQELRLSSKSHWDIPVTIDGKTIHVLASHPTPPVFDGPEDRNGKRNHDEIRFWHDYITAKQSSYIYDDKNVKGGIKDNNAFVILGDLNASATEGSAIREGITSLLNHPNIVDPIPASRGGKEHSKDNDNAKYHTAFWRMRADYVLPSKSGWEVVDAGVFWPQVNSTEYRLIDSRQASSDHRLVWVDLKFNH
ncbi:endonuclease/exonuclease/phosphatase family protein [Thalassotalea ganghwensis]